VEDAALLHAVLADQATPDLSGVQASDLHLLVCETFALEDVEDAPMTAFEGAVQRLSAAGARITRKPLPNVADAMALSGVLYTPEAYATCGELIEGAPEKMFPQVLERFRAGRDISVIDYLRGWRDLETYRATYLQDTAGYDAVLIPSGPILPPDAERLLAEEDFFVERNLMALRNTRIGNLLGLCALTLPTGVPSCGLMAMGAPFQEQHLLRVGAALEAALAV
jgi:aspartyl-tRNA(Asn)/glutamyl-tRNA(Gln) amidotransferase subunit A